MQRDLFDRLLHRQGQAGVVGVHHQSVLLGGLAPDDAAGDERGSTPYDQMGWKEHVPNQPISRAGGKMKEPNGQHGLGRRFSTGVKLGLGDPVHRLLLIRQRAL